MQNIALSARRLLRIMLEQAIADFYESTLEHSSVIGNEYYINNSGTGHAYDKDGIESCKAIFGTQPLDVLLSKHGLLSVCCLLCHRLYPEKFGCNAFDLAILR